MHDHITLPRARGTVSDRLEGACVHVTCDYLMTVCRAIAKVNKGEVP